MSAYRADRAVFLLGIAAICIVILSACSRMPIKDGELVVGKDTTATIEDFGVARLNNKF